MATAALAEPGASASVAVTAAMARIQMRCFIASTSTLEVPRRRDDPLVDRPIRSMKIDVHRDCGETSLGSLATEHATALTWR